MRASIAREHKCSVLKMPPHYDERRERESRVMRRRQLRRAASKRAEYAGKGGLHADIYFAREAVVFNASALSFAKVPASAIGMIKYKALPLLVRWRKSSIRKERVMG